MEASDLYAILYEILETCTVPDFLLFLKTFTTNAVLNGMDVTVLDLLNKMEEKCRLLILSKKWNVSEPSTSSFLAQRNTKRPTERDIRHAHNMLDRIKTLPT
jgi:hypothetical protein